MVYESPRGYDQGGDKRTGGNLQNTVVLPQEKRDSALKCIQKKKLRHQYEFRIRRFNRRATGRIQEWSGQEVPSGQYEPCENCYAHESSLFSEVTKIKDQCSCLVCLCE